MTEWISETELQSSEQQRLKPATTSLQGGFSSFPRVYRLRIISRKIVKAPASHPRPWLPADQVPRCWHKIWHNCVTLVHLNLSSSYCSSHVQASWVVGRDTNPDTLSLILYPLVRTVHKTCLRSIERIRCRLGRNSLTKDLVCICAAQALIASQGFCHHDGNKFAW